MTTCFKNYFQKIVHKAADATGEFTGNKTAHKIIKPKLVSYENSRNVEAIVIPPKKRKEIQNELRQVL